MLSDATYTRARTSPKTWLWARTTRLQQDCGQLDLGWTEHRHVTSALVTANGST